MKRVSLIGICWAIAFPAFAEPASPPKPKLIVAIAVDQFSSDLFNASRATFSGGLRRLAGGVVFPSGYQSHAATETCPGHSTILTGSRPSRTGIIANDWQNPKLPRIGRGGKESFDVYCAESPGAAGSNSAVPVISPNSLRVPTLGDRLKLIDPATRVLAVSGKDRAAVMMGGHRTDLTLWWNGKVFGSYGGSEATLPPTLVAINAKASAAIAKPVPIPVPKQCAQVSRSLSLSPTKAVGTIAARKPGDASSWRATPQFDAMTLDVALAGMDALKLGHGATTDVLAISFSGPDYVGHGFGTAGAEMCTQVAALDVTLGRLFARLDASKIPYVVVLTADHGGHDLPERNATQGLPAAHRVDAALSASEVGKKVAAQLGLRDTALIGRSNFGDMYISPTVPDEQRKAVLDAAVAFYRGHGDVAAVFTKEQLVAATSPKPPVEDWTLFERARASFDAERSGDFVVLLKSFVTPIPDLGQGYVATHGSPWGYDRRVPILFWWNSVSPFEQPNGVETVDILPTLASVIGLDIPASEIDGRCLDLVAGAASNCGAQ